ncbi:MAG: hypothetical protein ACFB0E_23365 [Leptolyngbyaceae cyanobacterium]
MVIRGFDVIVEHPLQQSLSPETHSTQLSEKTQQVECQGCRAQITFEPPDVAGDCPFCGTHISALPRKADPITTPSGILLFKINRQQAQQKLKEWLSSRRFAPTSLKQLAQREALTGVYLPFWTFDAQCHVQYTGRRKDRQTDWKPISGHLVRGCDDLMIPAVKTFDIESLKKLGPWPLKELSAYDPSFLRGFRTQRCQVSMRQAHTIAKEIMSRGVYEAIRADIGGDEQTISSEDTTFRCETFKHILLPLWIATYRFKKKSYQVIMNGESGKILGDHPYCPVKIARMIAGGLVAIGTLWGGYIYWNGDWQLPTLLTNPGSLRSNPSPSSLPAAIDIEPSSPKAPAAESTPAAAAPSAAFEEGLNLAYEAATKTQSAQTQQEWQEIINLWAEAINTLKKVPTDDPNAAIAQQKIQDYQRNLNYARERLAKAP